MTHPRWRAIARARRLPRWAVRVIATMRGSSLRGYVAAHAHAHDQLHTLVYVTPDSRTWLNYEVTW